jgi:hypothetical protein
MEEGEMVSPWELKRGDTFVFDDDPETELVFIGLDTPYMKVRALDPEKHKEMCARYDANSDFFAVMIGAPITLIVPKCFQVEKYEDQCGDVQGFVVVPRNYEGGEDERKSRES